jgi:hypothetical protein
MSYVIFAYDTGPCLIRMIHHRNRTQVCKQKDYTHKILLTNDEKQMIIDAEWVSRFLRTMHLVAKADRMYYWMSPQQQVVAMDIVKVFVHERWHGRDKPAMYRIGTWNLFELGMTWDCHSQCLRPRGDEKVERLNVAQEDLYNGPVQDE